MLVLSLFVMFSLTVVESGPTAWHWKTPTLVRQVDIVDLSRYPLALYTYRVTRI